MCASNYFNRGVCGCGCGHLIKTFVTSIDSELLSTLKSSCGLSAREMYSLHIESFPNSPPNIEETRGPYSTEWKIIDVGLEAVVFAGRLQACCGGSLICLFVVGGGVSFILGDLDLLDPLHHPRICRMKPTIMMEQFAIHEYLERSVPIFLHHPPLPSYILPLPPFLHRHVFLILLEQNCHLLSKTFTTALALFETPILRQK